MSPRTHDRVALALALALFSAVHSGVHAKTSDSEPDLEVVSSSEVQWGPLNPARGDKGPRAANLWGDRTTAGPSGFLVEFVDGFSSPPHIHNVAYRALVIHGRVHNDDPSAEATWLPTGSFWTQPAGDVHITSAKGEQNLVYVEIEKGPYLVRPPERAFDTGEAPIRSIASGLAWRNASDLVASGAPAVSISGEEPQVAPLWGDTKDGQQSGSLVKLPAGFDGRMRSDETMLRAIVIQGVVEYSARGEGDAQTLVPGSYFRSEGPSEPRVSCASGEDCLLYVRLSEKGTLDVPSTPTEP